MGNKNKTVHGVKYSLTTYRCGCCDTGIVQVLQEARRGHMYTSVSGCYDCGHEYGLHQAYRLKECGPDQELRWI